MGWMLLLLLQIVVAAAAAAAETTTTSLVAGCRLLVASCCWLVASCCCLGSHSHYSSFTQKIRLYVSISYVCASQPSVQFS